MDEKTRILFICTGNSARSQMAEGWTRSIGGDRVEAFSAGTEPAPEVHPLAVRVMAEVGVDISGQRPRSLDSFLDQPFDLVVTTCDQARESCPFFPGAAARQHWGLSDPAGATGTEEERLEVFRKVSAEIKERVLPLVSVPETASPDHPESLKKD